MADESRIENILDATLGEPGAEVPSPPFSRIEEKLIELKEAIESGGGGSTTNYNDLTNKPSINGHTLQGNSTLDTLGIASKSTLDAAIEELELMETELDRKVDKETGKGLSENDFTDADKADLSTALTKANAAAPQSTTYTKTEVDTALAAKLNTSDVDDALDSTSANPVQNKAVQAPIARLVDAGAKNLIDIRDQTLELQGISYIANGGIISASGTATGNPASRITFKSMLLMSGDYVLSGCPANGSDTTYRIEWWYSTNGTNYSPGIGNEYGTGLAFTLSTQMYVMPAIRFSNGYVASNLVFKPMICTAEDYSVSREFVPYTPTTRELYEMILALQNAQNGG